MGGYLSVPVTSPGTTPEGPQENQKAPFGRTRLPFDPRSISDEVARTPIQTRDQDSEDKPAPKKDEESAGTPVAAVNKALRNKMKELSLDPRSPSGIPRTPILLQGGDEEANAGSEGSENKEAKATQKACVPPKRGAAAPMAHKPVHKLNFDEVEEEEKEEKKEEDVEVEKEEEVKEEAEEEEEVNEPTAEVSTDSLASEACLLKQTSQTLVPQPSADKENLLLIENDDGDDESALAPKQQQQQQLSEPSPSKKMPLGVSSENTTLII